MTSKNFGWHKNWQTLPNGRRRHLSGLEFEHDEDLGWSARDDTLDEFQSYQLSSGTALHDVQSRLMRLAKECVEWQDG